MLRPVLFKRLVKSEAPASGYAWSDFIYEGTFHQWGNCYEEFESGPGNYTAAVIELPDGTIEMPLATNVKFTDNSAPAKEGE